MRMASIAGAAELKARLFHGFADPSRLGILDALRDGPRSVGEVVQATGLTQPNVSNHLACLLDCGLVARAQRGRYVFYRLSDDRVARLLGLAEGILADAARGLYECVSFQLPDEQGVDG